MTLAARSWASTDEGTSRRATTTPLAVPSEATAWEGARVTDRRHTLDDLASSLGLSANTVSRALRGKDGVGEAT